MKTKQLAETIQRLGIAKRAEIKAEDTREDLAQITEEALA
jgi:hypothetical protein